MSTHAYGPMDGGTFTFRLTYDYTGETAMEVSICSCYLLYVCIVFNVRWRHQGLELYNTGEWGEYSRNPVNIAETSLPHDSRCI